jgi:hypothetical protein
MPDHVISPTLFDSIDEYVELLRSGEAFSSNVVPVTSPVISFSENAFVQFFENEVGSEIKGFDLKYKQRAARVRYSKKADLSKQAIALIALFEQFCDVHPDVLGAGYGGQRSVLEAFHCKYVTRLLQRIRALAGVKRDGALRSRADSAMTSFGDAIARIDWGAI